MDIPNKTLGVIGGLGPLPTAYLAEMLALYSDVDKDQEHINLLIHSYPSTPDRTQFILGRSSQSPLPQILHTGKQLCQLGVDLLAIPCVTSHYFYDTMAREFSVPLVNMLEETAAAVQGQGVDCAGIMATSGTVEMGLFQGALEDKGLRWVIPEPEWQEKVMYLIYDCVKAGKPMDTKVFYEVFEHLRKKGAKRVILGCTELSAINRGESRAKDCVCALESLAKACLRRLGVKVKAL